MPITQSAKKALRQNISRRARNVVKKEAYKKAVKDFRAFVAEKKTEEAKKILSTVFKALDKCSYDPAVRYDDRVFMAVGFFVAH